MAHPRTPRLHRPCDHGSCAHRGPVGTLHRAHRPMAQPRHPHHRNDAGTAHPGPTHTLSTVVWHRNWDLRHRFGNTVHPTAVGRHLLGPGIRGCPHGRRIPSAGHDRNANHPARRTATGHAGHPRRTPLSSPASHRHRNGRSVHRGRRSGSVYYRRTSSQRHTAGPRWSARGHRPGTIARRDVRCCPAIEHTRSQSSCDRTRYRSPPHTSFRLTKENLP